MNSLPITCKDAKTTFLLARRAERLARPLVAKIPGGDLRIELTLGGDRRFEPYCFNMQVFQRVNGGLDLPFQEICIVSSADLDRKIELLRTVAESEAVAGHE